MTNQRYWNSGRRCMLLFAFLHALQVCAQTSKVDWSTFSGGNGPSSSASTHISSSTGENAVGRSAGSGRVIQSGFLGAIYGTTSVLDLAFTSGWNMISVPYRATDFRKSLLYPSNSSKAYIYLGHYETRDTLQNSTGYWLKFSGPAARQFSGFGFVKETLNVMDKWNMIAPPSYPIFASNITPLDTTTLTTFYYSYTSGGVPPYRRVDTLQPGRAYWIKVHNAGRVVMKLTSLVEPMSAAAGKTTPATQEAGSPINLQDMNTLTIRDAGGRQGVLYFSTESMNIDLNKWEIPPVAPDENMDVRFANSRILEAADPQQKKEVGIRISAAQYPITISWNLKDDTKGAKLRIDGKDVALTTMGEAHIQHLESQIKLSFMPSSERELPKEFALNQNFPNPFNPTTTIRYDLPIDGHAILKIYDILGQETATLVDEREEAGVKTVTWNASNVASGIYFLRLEVNDFHATRKLVLMK